VVTLHGRGAEHEVIGRLLAGALEGRSGVVVLRGEPGIGKTALLDYAAGAAGGMRVLRAAGVETEAELAYAGLHLLLRPALDRVDGLPEPQAAALRGAFALSVGGSDHRFLVGLAVLTILSELAEDRPVVCLVDDAHWLDAASADALLFAARRLEAEGVVMVLTARDGPRPFPAPGLPELHLAGLDACPAGRVLDDRAPLLGPALRDRVLAEANGNPLALVELAAAVTGEVAMAGAAPLPVTHRVQDLLAAQMRGLGEQAGLLLLLAAAEPTGDLDQVLQASQELGVGADALAPAERAGLVAVNHGRFVFRHPLVRTAAYHGAPLAARQAAHRALAWALDGQPDPVGRRAWHLAAAASGRDELVAAELERVAERSRERGGYGVVSAVYERAAQLTPDRQVRARRLLSAATAANDAGQLERAHRLADHAEQLTSDGLLLAQLAQLRVIMVTGDRPLRIRALADAAVSIADRHPALAARMLCHAFRAAQVEEMEKLSRHMADQICGLPLPPVTGLPPVDEALVQHARFVAGDRGASWQVIGDCVAAIRRDPSGADPRERVAASGLAFLLGDIDATWEISAALAADCRRHGILGWLPGALQGVTMAQILRGEWPQARASAAEGLKLAGDIGQRSRAAFLAGLAGLLCAYTGEEDRCQAWLAEHRRLGGPPGAYKKFHATQLSLLDLGYGRFGSAFERLAALPDTWLTDTEFIYRPDLVEAAARSGAPDRARQALAQFQAWAQTGGAPWALAVAHRCQALVSDDTTTEHHYQEAVRLHSSSGRPFEQGRTHLVYGEWLRRNRRRSDARIQLTAALDIFENLGAPSWAHRATTELSAAGAPAPVRLARPAGALSALTPQELQVVQLAADGLSNRDIATQMFLSPRTVGYHLYKAYPKLGVASRSELSRLVTAGRQMTG
jgi:DNA-binding CsgD family transcriptional regulator